MKRKNPGLFNGYWLDMQGNKIRRIYKAEYPELYRLHRICSTYERMDANREGGRQQETL